MPLYLTLIGLFVIAFGNGLFKGNLQAVVGQLYDDPKYSKLRDTAFMIFYMGINVGAFFAPFVATGVRNWFLKTQGFAHDGSLPAMCHAYLNGRMTDSASIAGLESLASKVSNMAVSGTDQLREFAANYINAFSKGYNYAFGLAAVAMIISLLVYVVFNKHLPNKTKVAARKSDRGPGIAADRQHAQPGHRPGDHRRHGGRIPFRSSTSSRWAWRWACSSASWPSYSRRRPRKKSRGSWP